MYDEWIGRSEVTSDVIAGTVARRAAATIDRPDLSLRPGDALPPMWHWLYFHAATPTRELGRDGHAMRGGMMPPVSLERRMFAGGSTKWKRPILIGSTLSRTETVEAISEKTSRSGTPLVFVSTRVDVADDDGPVLSETKTIVYMKPGPTPPAAPPTEVPSAQWSRTVTPNEAMLFRFSALTWNAHRIHYDSEFARGVDGHPALVVHGPLTALLLLDLWSRNDDRDLRSFSFRARHPAYVNEALILEGGSDGELLARTDSGTRVMTASAAARRSA